MTYWESWLLCEGELPALVGAYPDEISAVDALRVKVMSMVPGNWIFWCWLVAPDGTRVPVDEVAG